MKPPALRDDDVGRLARQVIGDDDNLPDLTAAPLLFDALMESGDRDAAMRLRTDLLEMLPSHIQGDDLNPRRRAAMLADFRGQLYRVLYCLTVDFNSACLCMAQFVQEMTVREQTESAKADVDVVRMQVPENTRIGHHVAIDETRMGVVLTERDGYGRASVMPIEDDQGEYDGPMQNSFEGKPSASLRSRRNRR